MLNEKAFSEAFKTYTKVRGNSIFCLRAAISAYLSAEIFRNSPAYGNLVFSTADTDKGEDTAVVVSGFENLSQAEDFVASIIHAQSK